MTARVRPALMGWSQARRSATEIAAPVARSRIALAEAGGATLGEPLRALAALPGYRAAAMDGYAVAGPGPWHVAGRALAGREVPGETLREGTAIEVATGAEVPRDATAILPYEESRCAGDVVTGVVEPGRHIRSREEVCAAGEELLPAGTVVTPAVLGLAASVGHEEVLARHPSVAVLITGDELADVGLPGPGHVRDALGPLLPGFIGGIGGRPIAATRVSDRHHALSEALAEARADVVVCCGASSAGPADHLRAVFAEQGADVRVDGVACRPGHPQLLSLLPDGRVVIGLPGNPYAAIAAALTLLAPVLHSLAGRVEEAPERAHLVDEAGAADGAGKVAAHPCDTRLLAVRRDGWGGAVPVGHNRPGGLRGVALADALAVVPPEWSAGAVELLPIPGSC